MAALSPIPVRLDETLVLRIGMIALSTDLTSERDAHTFLPGGSALHVTRVPFDNPTTPASLRRLAAHLTDAAALIAPGEPLAALIFSCTAASATIGDAAIERAIHAARPGVPVVTPPDAALRAFEAVGAHRIALLTPYLPETTAPVADYFADRGLDIVGAACLGLEDDREMARVAPGTILEAAAAVDRPQAAALFLSCTALPAVGVIEALEARIGKPVVTSNQASFWWALTLAGATARGPGRLFGGGTQRAA